MKTKDYTTTFTVDKPALSLPFSTRTFTGAPRRSLNSCQARKSYGTFRTAACASSSSESANFVKDKTEWDGTDIVFEIAKKGDKTELRFTHVGLVPAIECYGGCSGAWGFYINDSLRGLIATGEGKPIQKK